MQVGQVTEGRAGSPRGGVREGGSPQPGKSLKRWVLLTGFEAGLTPDGWVFRVIRGVNWVWSRGRPMARM